MKTIKILLSFAIIATLFTSCYTEVVVDDFNNDVITIKQFSEGLFIVNMNATSYDDCPVYDW